MNWFYYLHDKLYKMLAQSAGILLLSLYLLILGNGAVTVGTIVCVWCAYTVSSMALEFYQRRKHFDSIFGKMAHLEKPYLVHEFIQKTWLYEDELYKRIISGTAQAAMQEITALEKEQNEYKAFIEAWIHEVKLPISGLSLMSAELSAEQNRKLQTYLSDLENQVEQALFYARSDYVSQDYLIRRVTLERIISELLRKNKYLLIQNHMSVTMDCEASVLTDSKWIGFIINQIILNAVKYKKDKSGQIQFTSIVNQDSTQLFIRDHGMGIQDDELPRIFQKGFTGTNGRNISKSTGLGLYLCHKLCSKLGLGIEAHSVKDEYTEIVITFPQNSIVSDL